MRPPAIQYVVGIDSAKRAQVVCALDARTGKVHLRPRACAPARRPPQATAAGYAALRAVLQAWGAPGTIRLGLEATGCLWEPLYEDLPQAGYTVLGLNPRQTVAWAAGLGLRATTDGIDAHTLARGLLAGYAQASTVPSEAIQEWRALTRARRARVQGQTAATPRVATPRGRDELVVLFPALPDHTPGQRALLDPAVLRLLEICPSAQAIAQVPPDELAALLDRVSDGAWTREQAETLQRVAQQSAASARAVAARGIVVRTMVRHLLDLYQRLAELDAAIAAVLAHDDDGQRLQTLPGVGPVIAATVRAEVGDVSRFQGVDQGVADAGLDPRTHQSGAFIGQTHQTHLSQRGPGALRHALYLYLATLNAVRNRAEWRDRYRRLLDRGRPKKEALTILSRAYRKVVYHILRTSTVYDPLALTAPQPRPARGGAGLDIQYELFFRPHE